MLRHHSGGVIGLVTHGNTHDLKTFVGIIGIQLLHEIFGGEQ